MRRQDPERAKLRLASRALAACALLAAVFAACSSPSEPARSSPAVTEAAPAPDPGAGALERALAAVRAETIGIDLAFLASDELEGRDTPSRGQRVAARYLRGRLERMGMQPGARDGWFQRYSLESRRIDPRAIRCEYVAPGGEFQLIHGRSFGVPPTQLWQGELRAGAIYCGSGAKSDLAGLDLSRSWALCVDSGISSNKRMRELRAAGALGCIVVPSADGADPAERLATWSKLLENAPVHWPSEAAHETPALPCIWLDREHGARLLALASEVEGGPPKLGWDLGVSVSAASSGAGSLEVENVCAFWPGDDPALAAETIVVSAHYDHIGVSKQGEVFNGADDNASGTCALLALAEALVAHGPLARSVLLVWVSGEELGLFGSRAWAENPWLPGDARAVADVNLDMLGRNAPDFLQLTPSAAHPAYNSLSRAAEELAPLEGFAALASCDEDWDRSDHAMFAEHLGIPVAFLSAGEHEDYHEASDDAEKIDCDKIARATRLVLRMLDLLQARAIEAPELAAPEAAPAELPRDASR